MDWVGYLAGGGILGAIGTVLAFRRDSRDVEARRIHLEEVREKREKDRDAALIQTIKDSVNGEVRLLESENKHIKAIVEVTQQTVALLNQTIENKLATKQEMAMLTMRQEGDSLRIGALEREIRELQVGCAKCKNRETAAMRREA